MRRKLIRQGGGGYTIYLPKKWVDQQELDKDASVQIEIIDGQLLVTPEQEGKKRETTLVLTGRAESAIRTLITNAYRAGYDRITVTYDKQQQFEILQQVIKTRLIGFEIVNQDTHGCIVENITEPSPEQFETLIRKIFFNIAELFTITEQRLSGKGSELDFMESSERIQKYDNFCRRVLAKQKVQRRRTEMLWTFLGILIHGSRTLHYLLKFQEKKNVKSDTTLLTEVRETFNLLSRAYIEHDIKLLEQVHDNYQSVYYTRGHAELEQAKGDDTVIIHYLLDGLRQFYLAASPLAGYLM